MKRSKEMGLILGKADYQRIPPIYCAECSGETKLCVVHTGPACKPGQAAFKTTTEEYEAARRYFEPTLPK